MTILITGAAGFIGAALAAKLAEKNSVIGLDNLNHYYDPKLKLARLAELQKFPNFEFVECCLTDNEKLTEIFQKNQFDTVINLAAQAGVRYSIDNPKAYIDSNLVGFANILEQCRHYSVKHLLFASSSSVYGSNEKTPFSEQDGVDHPVSLYAATKKANELLAHSYASLFQLPCTGLRFFTVYGPWGRPDMAYYKFTKSILAEQPIDVYHHGQLMRDFTYIDDIIEGIVRLLDQPPIPNPDWNRMNPDPSTSYAPYTIYNIGNNQPVPLLDFIHTLETAIGKKAQLNFMPMQPGDVYATHADIIKLNRVTGFAPNTSLKQGLEKFVKWYRSYYL